MTDEQLTQVLGVMIDKINSIADSVNESNKNLLERIESLETNPKVEIEEEKEVIPDENDVEDMLERLRRKLAKPLVIPPNVKIIDDTPSQHYVPKTSTKHMKLKVSEHAGDTMGFGPIKE